MEIITGRELSNRLQPKMQYLRKHCGIIFAVDNVNTAFSRATITFTKIGGIDGLLTAHHVYDELKNGQTRIFCNLEEQAIQLPEARYSPLVPKFYFGTQLGEKLRFERHPGLLEAELLEQGRPQTGVWGRELRLNDRCFP
ncbi:MAG: hypothetical protein ACE5HO_16315 [bacterium]